MATSVLRELEELRLMLDTPRKTFSPLKTLKGLAETPRASMEPMRHYSTALSGAEKSVDRLGRAIEAAEEEMDAALKRTTDIHRSQLKQKELENLELQRVIGAKERSIDSLRDTLATTKRTYESKLSQVESALTLKDAEIKALSEELRVSRLERDSMSLQLERVEAGRRAVEVDAREREAELGADVRARSDEASKALMALRYEKKEKEDWRLQSEDMRRQMQVLQDDLRMHKDETALMKERYESELLDMRRRCALESDEVRRRSEADSEDFRRRCEAELEDMRRRLRSEKNLRKACEKWLRSELKSREEMELLLAAVKDAATGRTVAADSSEVEALIDRLRAGGSPSPPMRSPAASPRGMHYGGGGGGPTTLTVTAAPLANSAGARAMELDLLRRKLEEDNNKLKGELHAAKRMLTDRLKH